jgi:NAD(P)-dependent dehydrogenase (short-subunit alcohol dehydrogenase family)
MSPPKGTIIATGAAGGIGSGWVLSHLQTPQAKLYHTIYFIHPSAPGNLKQVLETYAPAEHTYEILPLDLSKMSEVRIAASSINDRVAKGELGKIKVLLLIAGAMFLDTRIKGSGGVTFTGEGIECNFAVNYLSNFLMILLLLKNLDKEGARIIAMGSTNHDPNNLSTKGAFHSKELKVLFGDGGTEDLVKATEKVRRGDEFPASVRRYGKYCGRNLFPIWTVF